MRKIQFEYNVKVFSKGVKRQFVVYARDTNELMSKITGILATREFCILAANKVKCWEMK